MADQGATPNVVARALSWGSTLCAIVGAFVPGVAVIPLLGRLLGLAAEGEPLAAQAWGDIEAAHAAGQPLTADHVAAAETAVTAIMINRGRGGGTTEMASG